MESKLRQDDADSWFFESFGRYKNLYMYEFEAPIDTMELLDPISLCTTGIQPYSKKCEILQLAIPPKLLPKDIEEGLCKDRDFKIISGGYSTSRIMQVKSVKDEQIVIAVQSNEEGLGVFRLGNADHGVVTEEKRLMFPVEQKQLESTSIWGPGVIATRNDQVLLGDLSGKYFCKWTLREPDKGTCYPMTNLQSVEKMTKIQFWNDNIVAFCTHNGVVLLYDLLQSLDKPISVISNTKSELISSDNPVQCHSFDTKPEQNLLGLVNSSGGFEMYDLKKPNTPLVTTVLPGYEAMSVLKGKFDLQFQKLEASPSSLNEDNTKFIVSGFKDEIIPVYQRTSSNDFVPVFTHDGHIKTVTGVMWHNMTDNLVFSTSIDSVLHAWQYIDSTES